MTNNTWITTTEDFWLDKWDSIQKENVSGMFTQTSSWLKSYMAYGFDFELLLKVNPEGEILAGLGNLIVKAGPFRSYICPWGPFLKEVNDFEEALDQFLSRARELKSFLAQLNPGVFDLNSNWKKSLEGFKFQEGDILKKIYAPQHFNLIQLPEQSEQEYEKILLKSFSENAKRNIKTGLKNNLILHRVKTKEELKNAYQCFESNAAREGYPIRAWEDVEESLEDAVQKENSILFYAEIEGQIIGSIWAAKGGKMLSYIMGGVDRTEKDFKLGHLLQWKCMLEAIEQGYSQYNISVGGSDGVVRFKNSFYPTTQSTHGPFYKVLDPLKFSIFKSVFPFFERNKKLAAKILKLIR
ncbi:lipid II:glycine glycyltransferase FemX [Algoriphagus boseongensis]|nr:peptidoglycan bridge formation glycyltransferase FemA/FemB family protein [Algoriphagus boseongensis]